VIKTLKSTCCQKIAADIHYHIFFSTAGPTAKDELEKIYVKILGDHLDPDVLLADSVDDDTLKLYQEIDQIAAAQESEQQHVVIGKVEIAKVLVSHLMCINEGEHMYSVLSGCFDFESGKVTSSVVLWQNVTATTLSIVLDNLGWKVSVQQAEEMITETEAYEIHQSMKITLDELMTQSKSFRCVHLSIMYTFEYTRRMHTSSNRHTHVGAGSF